MRGILFLILSFCLAGFAPNAWAVRVNSVYLAEIPVNSQSAQEKAQAAQDGLVRVLIKVSGNAQILDSYPSLKATLGQAQSLVQQYSYATRPLGKTTMTILTLRYDPEGINHLLQNAGAPIWGQNRPLIVVVLAMESQAHPLDIVDSADLDLQTGLKQAAKQRGLPVIFPVMDMTDMNQIAASDVMNKAVPKLQAATARYHGNALLIGHIKKTLVNINSEWTYVGENGPLSFNVTDVSYPALFAGVMNHLADSLVTQYAAPQTTTADMQVIMKVAGVKQQNDLMQLMKYLQHLTQVVDVQLTSVQGDVVVLTVSLHSNKQTFTQALSLGKNLQSQPNQDHMDDTLLYQWQP